MEFINSLDSSVLENAIIYCDPPYENTAEYAENEFKHSDFWEWFRKTPYCVYVSSYKAPEDILPLNFDFKRQTLAGGTGNKVVENIYWNGKGNPQETMEDILFGLGK